MSVSPSVFPTLFPRPSGARNIRRESADNICERWWQVVTRSNGHHPGAVARTLRFLVFLLYFLFYTSLCLNFLLQSSSCSFLFLFVYFLIFSSSAQKRERQGKGQSSYVHRLMVYLLFRLTLNKESKPLQPIRQESLQQIPV